MRGFTNDEEYKMLIKAGWTYWTTFYERCRYTRSKNNFILQIKPATRVN